MFSENYCQSYMDDWNDPGESCVMERSGLVKSATGSMQISIDSRDIKRLKNKSNNRSSQEHSMANKSPERLTEGSQSNQVLKLFDICVEFIAGKLYLVEDFVDFPDVIGYKIFSAAKCQDMFYSFANSTHRHAMMLFCDAYENQVLNELNISGRPWLPANLFSALGTFQHIVKLDMTGCRIGSTDSSMTYLSKFTSLEELNLQDNHLRDSHIRIFTAPLRMFNRGSTTLRKLSLSCNPQITDDSAKHLLCYKNMEHLDLSGTGFQNRGLELLQKNLHLKFRNVPASMCRSPICDTIGWAAEIVLQWLEQARPRTKDEIRSTRKVSTQIEDRNPVVFYSGTFEEETATRASKPQPDPVIVLCRTRLLRLDQCLHIEEVQNLSLKKKRTDNVFSLDEALDKITTDQTEVNECSPNLPPGDVEGVLNLAKTNSNYVKSQKVQSGKHRGPKCDENDMEMMMSYVKPSAESGESHSLFSAMSSDKW